MGKRSPTDGLAMTRWLETVRNPGTPRPESSWRPTSAGLLARRFSSLAQPSQPSRPVARGGRDSLLTVAGAALELASRGSPHQIPFSSPSGRTPSGTHVGYRAMLTPGSRWRQPRRPFGDFLAHAAPAVPPPMIRNIVRYVQESACRPDGTTISLQQSWIKFDNCALHHHTRSALTPDFSGGRAAQPRTRTHERQAPVDC